LRLKGGETFGVAVERLLDIAQHRLDPFESLLDRLTASGANPVTPIGYLRCGLPVRVTSTHGRGF